jgi:hypothetical protein
MKKETIFNIGITLFALAGVGLAIKVLVFPKKEKLLVNLKEYDSNVDLDKGQSFDYGYIWKRLQAYKKGNDNFTFNGKTYDTKTGRSI